MGTLNSTSQASTHAVTPTTAHKRFLPSLIALSCALTFAPSLQAQTLTLLSPDKQITVSLSEDAGKPQYHVSFKGEAVINPSRLGLVFKQIGEMGQDFKISQHSAANVDNTWQLPWGELQTIKDNHNGLIASLFFGPMLF
jgi:alpha-glucosidase